MKSLNALIRTLLIIFALTTLCTVTFAQDVHFNFDRGANFASYKTYEWIDNPRDAIPDQLIELSIKRSVDEQLARKGLIRVESGGDLKISYHALISLERAVSFTRNGDALLAGFGAIGNETGQAQTSTLPVGILIIDLVDSSKGRLVWRGDAQRIIDLKKDTRKNDRALQKAMEKLFKNYPPDQNK